MKARISTLIYMVIAFFCVLTSNLITIHDDCSVYTIFGIILLIEIISFIWANYRNSGGFLNFASIFAVLLMLFNFGHVFLLGFFQSALVEKTVVLKYFNVTDGYEALKWVNYAFVIICGMCLVKTKPNLNYQNKSESFFNQNYLIKKAMILIGCTFPIKIFIDINFLIRSLTIGFEYGKNWLNSFPNFIETIGNCSMIGFAFLIVVLKKEPQKQLRYYSIIVVYLLLLMISGRRSENVSYLCVLTFLFFATRNTNSINKLNIGRAIAICSFGYFVLLFLYTVVHTRDSSNNGIAFIFNRMWYYNSQENIILEEMREYGQTGYTAICVLVNWLGSHSPSYGTSYIYGISAVLPNIGGLMGVLTQQSIFGLSLQETSGILNSLYTNIGGNVIGEFFFNFGKVGGLVAAAFLGHFVGITNTKVIEGIKSNTYSVIYTIPLMFATLYWIRDYFGDSIRDIVWGVAICFILARLNVGVNLTEEKNESTYSSR